MFVSFYSLREMMLVLYYQPLKAVLPRLSIYLKCSLLLSVQEINTAERHVCLTRDVQTSLSLSMETTISKVTIKCYFLYYESGRQM